MQIFRPAVSARKRALALISAVALAIAGGFAIAPKQEAEKMPQFKGGEEAMYQWLAYNMRYPEQAALNNIQGCVEVQFVVKADSTISDVKVLRGVDPDLDAEAVRVVKAMPKWIPGEKDGKPVNAPYTLPLTFKLAQ